MTLSRPAIKRLASTQLCHRKPIHSALIPRPRPRKIFFRTWAFIQRFPVMPSFPRRRPFPFKDPSLPAFQTSDLCAFRVLMERYVREGSNVSATRVRRQVKASSKGEVEEWSKQRLQWGFRGLKLLSGLSVLMGADHFYRAFLT